MQPHRFIRTIDTVVEAMQFHDVVSARAIIDWIDGLRGDGWHPVARFDAAHNVLFVPSLTRPGEVQPDGWVVRWPSSEFQAFSAADFVDTFEPSGPAVPRRPAPAELIVGEHLVPARRRGLADWPL